MKKAIFGLCLSLLAGKAFAIETTARNVVLMDFTTGECLMAKDHEKPVPPASMSKLMTVYMLFDKLKTGAVSFDDEFSVSENAWRKGGAASGGSTMFLKINSNVKVDDLIKGIIIQSGNDACIAAAENLAGSEENFAEEMNKEAKKLGLFNSHFANATGLPHPDHKMSVEDLAKLSKIIIERFPEYYHLFSETSFTYNGIKQGNRNPLLYSMANADGLKTGHTEEAGFSLTASAKKGNRRLILVMTGMESNKERGEESSKVMGWGFREFDNYTMLKAGTKVATVPVFMGEEKEVNLLLADDIVATVERAKASAVKMTAVYEKPIKAPVKKGDKLGLVRVELPQGRVIETDLVADRDVEKLGMFGRMSANISYILFGAN